MTAPSAKVTITPELVARFAAYYRANPAWGIVHVSFDDGNWTHTVSGFTHDDDTDEDRAIAAIHDALTPSQRRRLRNKAEEAARG